ncbi:MAG: hypothetical protein AAF512_18650, partial [Pseudomonadota bacterium]
GMYSGPKTTVAVRLAMDAGEYERIGELKSPVPQEVKEQLTIYQQKLEIDEMRAAKSDSK